MIILRGARDSDLDSLLRFAQIPGMFNLPDDADTLRDRITKSKASFSATAPDLADTKYTFIAEDLETKEIIATSMIAGQHGTPESPHFYFQVGNEKRFSETINTGFIHGTLTLQFDTDGPTEIGALVVDPELRNHESRIGRQISFVRLLYVAGHRERFKEKIIAELLPPLNKRGLSPLWEAVGRRFTNMDYWEADQLCTKNKDFIFDLFPSGKIYTSFLPAEARNAVGKVGKETEPVFHMLKKIGFEFHNQIDPFDGGPHLWADVEKIAPIRKATPGKWGGQSADDQLEFTAGLLTIAGPRSGKEEFRAVAVEASTREGTIYVKTSSDKCHPSADAIDSALSIDLGDPVLFMPYY
ncbi:MAG: arginine N-succinyltransferase [Cryobacterium sp.]|nr:arginine N-succinyltransferase [Oligoflexia bacterium]